MALLKRLLTFVLVGVLLGGAVASLIAPRVISWYQEPGAGTAMCACAELATSTLSRLLYWQVIGAIIGGVTFLVLGIVLSVRRRGRGGTGGTSEKAAAPPAAPPPVAPPPTSPPVIPPP